MEATGIVKDLGLGVAQIRALKGVNLALNGGELTLLMGPSGSGKTTLLSILGCMLTPTEGTVRVRGDSIAGKTPEDLAKLRRENIGFVFQSYHLFPTLTAADNVRLALDVRGENGKARQGQIARGAGPGRAGQQDRELSAPAQRRRAAARGDRARRGRRSLGDPGRRADRGAGQRERQGDHGHPGRHRQGPRPRRAGRHPRSAAGAVCRPDRPYRGRQHRARRSRRGGADA